MLWLWGLGHQSKSKKEASTIMKIYLLSTVYLGKYHFLSGSTHTKRSFPHQYMIYIYLTSSSQVRSRPGEEDEKR